MMEMTERERLIELLKKAEFKETFTASDGKPVTSIHRRIVDMGEVDILADYLLANGVIVPPCKVMDVVYVAIDSPKPQVEKKVVESVTFGTYNDTVTFTDGTCFTLWGKSWERYHRSVFPTKEEAEQALKVRNE